MDDYHVCLCGAWCHAGSVASSLQRVAGAVCVSELCAGTRWHHSPPAPHPCFIAHGSLSPPVLSIRYVFNAAEGLQRVFTEHHMRTAKVAHIFCTEVSFNCLGGLPGMLLTVADARRQGVSVFGPRGLTAFLASTRRFMRGYGARAVGGFELLVALFCWPACMKPCVYELLRCGYSHSLYAPFR